MSRQVIEPTAVVELGPAFAGNSINTAIYRHHGLVTWKGSQYTAFYRDAATIRVFRRHLADGAEQHMDLPAPHPISDAHNTISLGIDQDDRVHMAICRHAAGLAYLTSLLPASISGWSQGENMPGVSNGTITYPTFVMAGESSPAPLLFLYREGYPDNGEARLKRYAQGARQWIDNESAVLSGATDSVRSSGPYWNHPVYDSTGDLHISFVWRTSPVGHPAVISNRGICYARSSDYGKTWISAGGRNLGLPMTPETSETVFAVPPASGLINQTGMALDSGNRPHIAFYAEDPRGIPQYFHLWFDGRQWQCTMASSRSARFVLSAAGTLPLPISRPEIVMDRSDNAYLLFRADFTEGCLAAIRLRAPDYTAQPDQLRILWGESLDFAEPVIDRLRWQAEQVLSVLVQRNDQPREESYAAAKSAPIRIIEWDLVSGW